MRKNILLTVIVLLTIANSFSGCNNDAETSIEKTTIQTTTEVSTDEVTVKPTSETATDDATSQTVIELPTEEMTPKASQSDYYEAYKKVIQQNAGTIKAYDWQFANNNSKNIVFSDIVGDEIPELIFVGSKENGGFKFAKLMIYTYYDDNSHCIFSADEKEFSLQSNVQAVNGYHLFKNKDDKNLYISQYGAMVGRDFTIYRLEADEDNGNDLSVEYLMQQHEAYVPDVENVSGIENTGIISGEDVGFEECEQYKYNLFNNMSSLLMYSDNNPEEYSKYLNDDDNQAMSYADAIEFLNRSDPDSQNENTDYSIIAGDYIVRKNGGIGSTLKIDSDGTFVEETNGFFADEYQKSICRGRISNLKKENDYKYTFYVTDTKLDNEPDSSGKESVNGRYIDVRYIDNEFDTGSQFTLYLKGALPDEMTDENLEEYKSWPGVDYEAPINNSLIFLVNGHIYDKRDDIE